MPIRKAVTIVALGFVCGFCAVAAYLTYSDTHQLSTRVITLAAGAVVSFIGALAVNRFL